MGVHMYNVWKYVVPGPWLSIKLIYQNPEDVINSPVSMCKVSPLEPTFCAVGTPVIV